MTAFWLLLVFCFLFSSSSLGGETPIELERELASISLGMSIQEVEKYYEMSEGDPWFINILTKGQKEAAFDQTYIRKAKEKTYSLKGALPPHVKNLRAVFLKGQLYLITLDMEKEFLESVDWPTFIKPYVEKYGPSAESSNQGNTSREEWKDGKTYLELTQIAQSPTVDWSYRISLIDISLDNQANEIWNFVAISFDAEKGNIEAQRALGLAYYFGEGTTPDHAQAAHWWLKGASQGDAKSQFALGLLYSKGKGVKKDPAKAVYWYEKAAQQGFSGGQVNLGYSYMEGEGVEKDYKKGLHWNLLAANQGSAAAQSNLGEIYRDGLGVVQDYVQAHMWFNLAAAQSLEEAIKNRDELSKKMASEQIAAAQKLALEWKPPKTPKDRKWNFARDIDGDGHFTIDDVTGWVGWLFYYPGDRVIQWLLSNEKVDTAHFFKITPQDYGGGLSFLFSLVGWGLGSIAFFMVLGVIAKILDRTDEFSRSVAQYVKGKWETIKQKKN
ncbi:tetratricopeptide repeat protein [Nitrospira sp. MA-1]|nr:tetratricopeptide repeat protein [Nitrospira sp. MA-1]